MFCPKCATQNADGASFCRSCGANISLIPQALTGDLLTASKDEACSVTGKPRKEVGLDQALRNIFVGIAFFLISLALANSIGRGWWFWLLIPAFSMLGTGIAQYFRWKEIKARFNGPDMRPSLAEPVPPREISRKNTGEMMAPVASVTEGTTRHLGVEAATRHLGSEEKVQR